MFYIFQKNQMRISGRYWNTRCSILGHVVFCLCIAGLVLAVLNHQYVNKMKLEDEEYCEHNQCKFTILLVAPLVVLILIIIFIYGCLMCEALISNTKLFTENLQRADDVVRLIEQRRLAPPKITIEVECWHAHIKQHRRVVTFAKTIVFPIKKCVDISGDIDPAIFKPGHITRVSDSRLLLLIWRYQHMCFALSVGKNKSCRITSLMTYYSIQYTH